MSDVSTHFPNQRGLNNWVIEPERFLSQHFELYQDDELVTTLKMGCWREGCEFAIAGHPFAIVRKSLWRDGFQLKCGGDVFCDVKRSFWSRRFELATADGLWRLQPAGWFTRTYQLLVGERVVGTISPAGWFTRKRVSQFSSEVPPPIQVLAIFLALIVSRRRQHSSAGS